MVVGMGPKNLGDGGALPLGIGHGRPPRNTPLHHMRYHAEFVRTRSNGISVISEIGHKNLTIRVPPFKVTQGH